VVEPVGSGSESITCVGTEPIMLAAAWAVDDVPSLVFMGAWSRVLFVPSSEMVAAVDWIERPRP
jgi:hypothetical protein